MDIVDYGPDGGDGPKLAAMLARPPTCCAMCSAKFVREQVEPEHAKATDFTYGYEGGAPELFVSGIREDRPSIGWVAYICQDCSKQDRGEIEATLVRGLTSEHPGAVVLPNLWPDEWFRSEEPRQVCIADGDGDDEMPF